MALEQRRSVFLHKVGIWSTALAALDVRVHVIGDGALDSLGGDSALESGTWPIPRARGTQFVQDKLVDMVFISVHHRDDLVEISKDGVGTFNHDLRSGESPTRTRGDFLGNVFTGPVKEALVIKVGHDFPPVLPPFKTFPLGLFAGKH